MLKCLEKHPRRRYHSAEALAEDLDRWLADLPIRARPATLSHRVSQVGAPPPGGRRLDPRGRGRHAGHRARDSRLSSVPQSFVATSPTEREKQKRSATRALEAQKRERLMEEENYAQHDPDCRTASGEHRSRPGRSAPGRGLAGRLPAPSARLGVGISEKTAERRNPHDLRAFGVPLRQ